MAVAVAAAVTVGMWEWGWGSWRWEVRRARGRGGQPHPLPLPTLSIRRYDRHLSRTHARMGIHWMWMRAGMVNQLSTDALLRR